MKAILFGITLKYLLAVLFTGMTGGDVYSVWSDNGLHLMMCDNGTPDDFDDDWVVDWETNRDVDVTILDK